MKQFPFRRGSFARRCATLLGAAGLLATLWSQPVLAQTETSAPAAPAGVWDYAERLGFSAEQKQAALRLRDELIAARGHLEQATVTNTPPDVQRLARLDFARQVRALRAGQLALLTAEQQQKYGELRHPVRTPGMSDPVEKTRPAGEAEENAPGEVNSARVKIRPLLGDAAPSSRPGRAARRDRRSRRCDPKCPPAGAAAVRPRRRALRP